MRIGVMLRTIDERQGIGIYTQNVMDHLLELDRHNEYVLFYNRDGCLGRYSACPNVRELALSGRAKGPWDQLQVPYAARRHRVDVLFHPKFTVPLASGIPAVMVLHGSEWYVHPESYGILDRIYVRTMMPLYCRKARRIISVSDMTKRDLMRFLGVESSKIETIYFGVDPQFRQISDEATLAAARRKYSLPPKFILFVGRIYPGKNFGGLLEAFAAIARELPHQLVVAGYAGASQPDAFAAVGPLGLRERVQFLDWVPQADLPGLYNLADLFVYPSFYEAFGIPLLEAMACGCPIVASKTGAIPEIAGDVGYLVDPHEPNSIARGMQAVLDDTELRRRMVAKGLDRVRRFDWGTCARKTLAVLESARSAPGLSAEAEAGAIDGRT